eukprot:COSAG03_NODE_13032_length_520_cov_0.969121_1_plen_59_part_10
MEQSNKDGVRRWVGAARRTRRQHRPGLGPHGRTLRRCSEGCVRLALADTEKEREGEGEG